MNLGNRQNNSFFGLTMDVWEDKVYFEGQAFEAGYFAAEVMNRSREENTKLVFRGGEVAQCVMAVQRGEWPLKLESMVLEQLDRIRGIPPFHLIDMDREVIFFRKLCGEKYRQRSLDPETREHEYLMRWLSALVRIGVAVVNYINAAMNLEAFFLHRLKKRDETSFAVAVHDWAANPDLMEFLREHELIDQERFTLFPQLEQSYVFARNPKNEKGMVFVSRVRFESFISFYLFDLLNGMHHGHAPHMCEHCLKYHLTTKAYAVKYCDGMSPRYPGLTCRQAGARAGNKEDNAAHPIFRLHKTRTNTIRKHHNRGKISDEVREAALRRADALRAEALINSAYAAEGYERDMKLERIYAAVEKEL